MLVLVERFQNTQCIAVCCVWGCIAADQSGCPCWPLSTVESANSRHVSIRTGPQRNGRSGGLVWWIAFSFTSRGWPGACASLAWRTHGTRKHYRKKASRRRQRDALRNVLLGNLGSCHPCGCYFDTDHQPIHGGTTSQVTGFKGYAANILVPDTTAHFQGYSGGHAWMGQGCFGSKRGTNTILGRCSGWSVHILHVSHK